MIRSLTERHLMALSVAAGALALGAGATGLAMTAAGTTKPSPTHVAAAAAPPVGVRPAASILCVAVLHQWGVCVGPPTT